MILHQKVTSGERGGRGGEIGQGDEEVQTTRYKINKLQGCNVQHREYSQYFIITLNGEYSINILNHLAVHLKLI